MIKDIEVKKKLSSRWFEYLQSEICKQFELLEKKVSKKSKVFKKRIWHKKNKDEGGGISYILENGNIFDKVGVNKSTVSGKFQKKFRSKIMGAEKKWSILGVRYFCSCTYEESKNACGSF